ncbi:uncharacterized protein N7484_007071 [Penicillium longicatenatum]|uniref:uncharacterized protein n=1 Tax=Penicillium longicatenatum TaxID=1561947 RepID=UPI00254756F8|nr:uncharacterized protein N7484_007071 [Penicillium longicatenatum]KAJ5639209.1 hypothetical protein N7484_007071 [Penicillium longicatenatum]
MPAARSLDSLPFDIFYEIATSLDDRDFINLSRTNRALRDLAQSDLVARKTVENVLLFSKEGQLALHQAGYTYRKAVGHRFDIHEAVATAAPYSVSVLAYGAEFLYNQGILCYRVGHEIRLLDVHAGSKQERVLNLLVLFRRLTSEPLGADAVDRVSLLRYADGILVFRVDTDDDQDDLLLAMDMSNRLHHPRKGRLLLKKWIPAGARVFVRHSRTYIWYGIFTAVGGSDGVWTVYGMDMTSATLEPMKPTLTRIVDGDLGQSLCFEMYNEHLYVVSTQVTSDEDERYSSFYHWFCFAPRQNRRKWSGSIWRREHCEGPINELWTDLSITTDEVTGRPVILECRREYAEGKSENHRTYYTQALQTPEELLTRYGEGEEATPILFSDSGETSECQESTRDSNEHRPEKRLRRDYHAEYESTHDPTKRQEFIAARTKHRSYNLAASTFIDLVNDPALQSDGFRSQDRLRLRTVSRKRKCPIDEEGDEGPSGLLFRPTQYNEDGSPVEGSEERFVSRGVYMWPPDDAPAELRRLLCPDSRINTVCAISDERSLIYSVRCAGVPAGNQAMVLISFDPQIHFPTLSSLHTMKAPIPDKIFSVEAPLAEASTSLVREDKPLYEAIKWGYWLR